MESSLNKSNNLLTSLNNLTNSSIYTGLVVVSTHSTSSMTQVFLDPYELQSFNLTNFYPLVIVTLLIPSIGYSLFDLGPLNLSSAPFIIIFIPYNYLKPKLTLVSDPSISASFNEAKLLQNPKYKP